jgi:hypothetical protein
MAKVAPDGPVTKTFAFRTSTMLLFSIIRTRTRFLSPAQHSNSTYSGNVVANLMNDTAKHTKLRINKSEFDIINDIIDSKTDYFNFEIINEKTFILTFDSIDKAIDLDELIKEKLIYKGFDIDYNPTNLGLIL